MQSDYKRRIGNMIQEIRTTRGLTQSQLAKSLSTSQSAVNRIEHGGQNISLEMIARIGDVLSSEIVAIATPGSINFRVHGGKKLSGTIEVKTSKNAAVALLCGALLNRGVTTLKHIARIEEVNRIIEVLHSIGVKTRWLENNDLEITPPARLKLENIDAQAAKRTRTVIMLLGPLIHRYNRFSLPYAGGCELGSRTVEPHLASLKAFGLEVTAKPDFYDVRVSKKNPKHPIVLTERGETLTENVIMAAAANDSVTIIRNASFNYMVQDLCLFLQKLGIKIDGIGTTTLTIKGSSSIDKKVEYYPSEDPIEAMSFLSAAIVTKSEITIKRAPIEFLEIELAVLENMGFQYSKSAEYSANNGHTRLVDITTKPSQLVAPIDKIHSQAFPAINMDNLPFFAVIAATAKGRTLIHDWSYETRAIYLTELSKLNVKLELLDPHRVYIDGPTKWKAAEMITPPALRPAVVILLGMLAAPGISTLRNIYSISRGYEDLAARLNSIGAQIKPFREI